jgi:intermembrane space import and assembly protein 40
MMAAAAIEPSSGAGGDLEDFAVLAASARSDANARARVSMAAAGEAIAVAIARGDGAAGTTEDAIKAAMECPCVADLKNSACGEAFAGALGCFMSADAEERGSKCVKEFVAMHACMVENSKEFEAFTAELVEAKERR